MLVRALGWDAAAAALAPDTPGFADVPLSSPHWAAATYLKTKGVLARAMRNRWAAATWSSASPTLALRKHVAVILCRVLDLPQ